MKKWRLSPSCLRSDLPPHGAIPNDLGEDLVPCAQARGAELVVFAVDEEKIVAGADGAGADDL